MPIVVHGSRDRMRGESHLLALPAELRMRIYDYVTMGDLQTFVDKMTKPSLLKTSRQIREEYPDIFFSNEALKVDAFYGAAGEWHQIRNQQTKRAIFEDCIFTDLLEFWSLASARRYCQRLYSNWQGNVQTGIMTVMTRSGIRRWQWSLAQAD